MYLLLKLLLSFSHPVRNRELLLRKLLLMWRINVSRLYKNVVIPMSDSLKCTTLRESDTHTCCHYRRVQATKLYKVLGKPTSSLLFRSVSLACRSFSFFFKSWIVTRVKKGSLNCSLTMKHTITVFIRKLNIQSSSCQLTNLTFALSRGISTVEARAELPFWTF